MIFGNLCLTLFAWQGYPGGLDGKESACSVGDPVQSLNWEDPLEKEMATHSSILVWKNPMDGRAWSTIVHGVAQLDRTEQLLFLSLFTWHSVSMVHLYCSIYWYFIAFYDWIFQYGYTILFSIYDMMHIWLVSTFCFLFIVLNHL